MSKKSDATSIKNHLVFTLAKISIRLRDPAPITRGDRMQLRLLIEEAIARERQSRK